VLAGVDFITCAGTLDSTMTESDALLVLDDELCGAALRAARGIEVNDDTLALNLVRDINFRGHYMAEEHTVSHYRKEHFIPSLLPREPYDAWVKAGSRSALDNARQRVSHILERHQPRTLDPVLEQELDEFRQAVSRRTIEEFYAGELEENQEWEAI
jgi:trimethylamine--corrinoid protein Co-methyltransferase